MSCQNQKNNGLAKCFNATSRKQRLGQALFSFQIQVNEKNLHHSFFSFHVSGDGLRRFNGQFDNRAIPKQRGKNLR